MNNTVEVRFKPADVGSVSDGAITDVKVAAGAAIDASKLAADSITATEIGVGVITATEIGAGVISATELADSYVKGAAADTTGDKGITAIGWDDVTSEVVVDHEA